MTGQLFKDYVPFAFCPELGQEVTAEDILVQKEKYPHQTLRFECPDCGEPLEYRLQRWGWGYFPIFKAQPGDNHERCYVPTPLSSFGQNQNPHQIHLAYDAMVKAFANFSEAYEAFKRFNSVSFELN